MADLTRRRLLRAAAALGLVAALAAGKPLLTWLDVHLLRESLKDAWGRHVQAEDWSTLPALPPRQDYRWLDTAGAPVRVAHALGESGEPGQDTLAALDRAIAAGLRLLEIDVWLDRDGKLRCHHGPDEPSAQRPGDCTLRAAAVAARSADAWLILDLKTDFARTGERLLAEVADPPLRARLVFQLYRPEDVRLFERWQAEAPLPGPIVTSYLARRSLRHLASNAARIGARALTVPLYRLPALGRRPAGLAVLTHPVHDCGQAQQARGADGYYLRTALLPALRAGCSR